MAGLGSATWYFLFVALIPGHLLGWGVEWGVAVCTALAGMVRYARFAERFPKASKIGLVALAVLLLLSSVAYLLTLHIQKSSSGPRDLFDLIKPVLIYFSCILGLTLSTVSGRELRLAARIVLIYSAACAVILAMDIPGLDPVVTALYGSTKTAISGYFVRLSIPFENPNFLGFFAVLTLCLGLFSGRSVDWVLAVLALGVAALTGSRTAWATSAMVVAVYFAISLGEQVTRLRGPTLRAMVVAIVMSITIYINWNVVVEGNQRLLDFVELARTGDLSADASYSDRLQARRAALSLLSESPVLGVGAMKYSEVGVIDNQYFGLLLRFGVLGTVIAFLLVGVVMGHRLLTMKPGDRVVGFLASCCVVLVWGWTGSFFDNVRLASLCVLLLSVVGRRNDTVAD